MVALLPNGYIKLLGKDWSLKGLIDLFGYLTDERNALRSLKTFVKHCFLRNNILLWRVLWLMETENCWNGELCLSQQYSVKLKR